MTTDAAVALAGLAAAIAGGDRSSLRVVRIQRLRLRASTTSIGPPRRGRWHALVPAVAAITAAVLSAGPVAAALGVGALGVVLLLRRRARSQRARRQAHSDVTDACLALAAEFAAGAPPMSALRTVAVEWPELFATAAGQAATGGDPARALRQTAVRPGAEALTAVAAAWEVSERTGARLGTALVAVADAIRADDAVRREADAQLGMVRATARLLALLPVATLALFSTGAGDPVGFLVGTGYGIVCLSAALVLVGAGMLWVDRTARVATRSAWQ